VRTVPALTAAASGVLAIAIYASVLRFRGLLIMLLQSRSKSREKPRPQGLVRTSGEPLNLPLSWSRTLEVANANRGCALGYITRKLRERLGLSVRFHIPPDPVGAEIT
jgi:hypothetical protein